MGKIDVDDFTDFTEDEYVKNIERLKINNHIDLVGKEVYYSKAVYGSHKVVRWCSLRREYLLDNDGYKFFSNPFRIILID